MRRLGVPSIYESNRVSREMATRPLQGGVVPARHRNMLRIRRMQHPVREIEVTRWSAPEGESLLAISNSGRFWVTGSLPRSDEEEVTATLYHDGVAQHTFGPARMQINLVTDEGVIAGQRSKGKYAVMFIDDHELSAKAFPLRITHDNQIVYLDFFDDEIVCLKTSAFEQEPTCLGRWPHESLSKIEWLSHAEIAVSGEGTVVFRPTSPYCMLEPCVLNQRRDQEMEILFGAIEGGVLDIASDGTLAGVHENRPIRISPSGDVESFALDDGAGATAISDNGEVIAGAFGIFASSKEYGNFVIRNGQVGVLPSRNIDALEPQYVCNNGNLIVYDINERRNVILCPK